MNELRLEELTVLISRELYAEAIGLPYDETATHAYAAELEAEYYSALNDPAGRDLALDGLADARTTEWYLRLLGIMDETLAFPNFVAGGEAVTWRNWKEAERELNDAGARRELFAGFVEKSTVLMPLIEERYLARRKLHEAHGTTPLDIFARRERTTPQTIRALCLQLGQLCRERFRSALSDLARQVFGPGEVAAAELHALYLNRMYEPTDPLFAGRDSLADVRTAFTGLGFALDSIPVDLADRPKKHGGAFCYPVQVPGDVRVAVCPVSPHHLTDMLFHEFGHAVHFAGIDPARPFADRYWIRAGTHETFSTLFESLLGLPGFLREVLSFRDQEIAQLMTFDRFKSLLTGTWLAATGATVCDAWLERLSWLEIESRFAAYVERFTNVSIPPGFARLDSLMNEVHPYPLGYVIAVARVAHWLDELASEFGERWWADKRASDSIRERIRQGGAVRFDESWMNTIAFERRWLAN